MKKALRGLPAFLILTGMLSCSRHSTSAGNDCIAALITPSGSTISSAQLDSVNNLFSKNNLTTTGLQFISMTTFSAGPTHIQVDARQFVNGLLALYEDEIFDFDNTGTLIYPIQGGYTGAAPDKDTTTHQSLESLRQAFLNNYKNCTIQGGPINSKPYHPTAPYQDTCLVAQLVYVDSATGQTGVAYGADLVEAWLVYPADMTSAYNPKPPFPEVTVIDKTGAAVPTVLSIP